MIPAYPDPPTVYLCLELFAHIYDIEAPSTSVIMQYGVLHRCFSTTLMETLCCGLLFANIINEKYSS